MKEFKYFLDSNIFLRPIIKDDPRQAEECKILFEKIKSGEIKALTSSLVLAEIAWVCKSVYGLGSGEIVKILKGILGFKYIKFVDDFDPFLAVEIFQNFNVKFIDCLTASNAWIYKREVAIISYDGDFDKLNVIRKEPAEVA